MDALCVAMLVASAALTPAAAVGGVETHQRSWGALAAPAVGGVHRDATLTAPASAPLMALRLKGGRGCTGTRNSCKQRGYHINAGVQKNAKRNKPIALSHKPCSGPHALSKVERYHGADVVLQVPLLAVLREGWPVSVMCFVLCDGVSRRRRGFV